MPFTKEERLNLGLGQLSLCISDTDLSGIPGSAYGWYYVKVVPCNPEVVKGYKDFFRQRFVSEGYRIMPMAITKRYVGNDGSITIAHEGCGNLFIYKPDDMAPNLIRRIVEEARQLDEEHPNKDEAENIVTLFEE